MHHEHSFHWDIDPLGVVVQRHFKIKKPGLPWALTLRGGFKETEKVFKQCNFFSASFSTRQAAVEALCLACGVDEKDVVLRRSGFRAAGYWLTSDNKLSVSNHHNYLTAWPGDKSEWRISYAEMHEPEESYPEITAWLKSKGLFEVEFKTRAQALAALQEALAN
jgi:hypothetical protein